MVAHCVTFYEYINVDGKEDTDTVMVNTSLEKFHKSSRKNIPECRRTYNLCQSKNDKI